MDLKNLKVQELDAQEMKKVEGGAWPVVAAVVVACAIFAAGVYVGYKQAENNAK